MNDTYWEGRSSYYRGVYIQGAQALAALGDPTLVDCALRLCLESLSAFGQRLARLRIDEPAGRVIDGCTLAPVRRAIIHHVGLRF